MMRAPYALREARIPHAEREEYILCLSSSRSIVRQ